MWGKVFFKPTVDIYKKIYYIAQVIIFYIGIYVDFWSIITIIMS